MISTAKLGPQYRPLFNLRFLFALLTEDVMDAALNCVIVWLRDSFAVMRPSNLGSYAWVLHTVSDSAGSEVPPCIPSNLLSKFGVSLYVHKY